MLEADVRLHGVTMPELLRVSQIGAEGGAGVNLAWAHGPWAHAVEPLCVANDEV
jgi:hypothetical protein